MMVNDSFTTSKIVELFGLIIARPEEPNPFSRAGHVLEYVRMPSVRPDFVATKIYVIRIVISQRRPSRPSHP
jgi:hypothetical protein